VRKTDRVAKICKPIKNKRRIAATEAFLRKRGAAFACFALIRFSCIHHFGELTIFAIRPDLTGLGLGFDRCSVRSFSKPIEQANNIDGIHNGWEHSLPCE
jgi:hypothetical protein